MNLFRLLIIAAVVWLIVRLVRNALPKPAADQPAPRRTSRSEHMVRCARCGLHVPEREALSRDGRHFCSAEHRDASEQ